MMPLFLVLALFASLIVSVALTPPSASPLARMRARPRRTSALLLALAFVALVAVLTAPTLSLSRPGAAVASMVLAGAAAGVVISMLSYSFAVDLRYHLSKIVPVFMRSDHGALDGGNYVPLDIQYRWLHFRGRVFAQRSRPLTA